MITKLRNVSLKPPKNQLFYRVMAYIMTVFALNAQYWTWYDMPKSRLIRLQRWIVFFAPPTATVSQVVYIVLHYEELEFITLSMISTILPVTMVLWLKVSLAQTPSFKIVMEDFMSKIHLYNYYVKDREDYVKQVLTYAEKVSRWFIFFYMWICYVCTSSFEIVPIIHNFQNIQSWNNITSRLEIIVHFWLPFDYEFNRFNWAVVQVVGIYCGFLTMTIIAVFDINYMSFLHHFVGHIKILKHRIKTSFHNNMSQEEIKHNLIEISKYYAFITKTKKDIEVAFKYNVAGIYLHNWFGGGIFIYQLMTSGTNLETICTYGLMLPIYMGILIVMSLTLEDVRIEADEIPALIYGLSWDDMSIANQKLVQMLLFQVQHSLEFKAAFNIKTGVQPAVNIIKTTFSFYVMIKSRL